MSSSLRSIPPLIPLPSSNDQSKRTSNHAPLPSSSSSRTKGPSLPNSLGASDIDHFASLFSPDPPRSAPAPLTPSGGPLFTPAAPTSPSRPTHHRSFSSVDSEFGAFVSVPATDDPLSAFLPMSPGIGAPQPVDPETVEDLAGLNGNAKGNPNTTLDFFDDFTSRAKDAAERNRRGVLDELLKHEDTPMHRTHPPPPSPPPSPSPSYSPQQPQSQLHLPGTSQTHQDDDRPQLKPRPSSPTMSRVHPQSPVAPQLTGRSTPPSASSSSLSHPHSSSKSPPPMMGSPPFKSFSQPPSAQSTLSRISSGWVSSFLSQSGSRMRSSEDSTSSASSSTFLESTAAGLPASSITHGTPFGTTTFVPPSGAPGFTGDRNWDKRGFSASYESEERDKERRGEKAVRLVGRREGTSSVLTVELADQIRSHMPALTRLPRSWTLLYSADQHGISLNTLYSRCEPKPPNSPGATKGALVVVKDANDGLFGTWVEDGLRVSKGYYGSGESFLWRHDKDKGLMVYKWTGRNGYVALCEPDSVSFGGGDGHYGLYIDSSLLDGSTAPCPTFGNEALCSRGSRRGVSVAFDVVGLEVWGVGP